MSVYVILRPQPKQKKQSHYNIAKVMTTYTQKWHHLNKPNFIRYWNFSFSLEYKASRHLFIKNLFTDRK